jgi:Leucine-rich repeat (LRR) protein
LEQFLGSGLRQNTHLTVLNVSENSLPLLPESFGIVFSNLKELHLNNNNLSHLPSSLSEMKHLQVLNLSHNRFQEFPSVLQLVSSLEELSLYKNKLTTLPTWIITALKVRTLFCGELGSLLLSPSLYSCALCLCPLLLVCACVRFSSPLSLHCLSCSRF